MIDIQIDQYKKFAKIIPSSEIDKREIYLKRDVRKSPNDTRFDPTDGSNQCRYAVQSVWLRTQFHGGSSSGEVHGPNSSSTDH